MSESERSYQDLLRKLDEFIRRYYKNQLIRGGLYAVGILMLFFLGVTTAEYLGEFSITVRTILFYGFLAGTGLVLTKFIAIPLVKLYSLGNRLSYEEAAAIIGSHFQDVKDKLTNLLQLSRETGRLDQEGASLLEASIMQKTKELNPIPFSSAIDLTQNKKYVKYALFPVIFVGLIAFLYPALVQESTARLVHHRTFFEPIIPFEFIIENDNLEAVQQENYALSVRMRGEELPNDVYIEFDGSNYRLDKSGKINFKYLFRNIQKAKTFRLIANGFYSREYELKVMPKPLIMDFEAALLFPAYTKRSAEHLNNTGDMIIPEGTKVAWTFNTVNTDMVTLHFTNMKDDRPTEAERDAANRYSFSNRFFKNGSYTIKTRNQFVKDRDSITYWINVVPDLFPSIKVDEQVDSNNSKRLYFAGLVKDDYGFEQLTFNYTKTGTDGTADLISLPVTIARGISQAQFFHFWDLNEIEINAGDEIAYYFEIWDNDGVNGSKATKSDRRVYKAPSLKEISDKTDKNNDKIKEDIEKSTLLARKLQRDLKDLNKKMLDKKTLTWEEKQKMKELLESQKELQKSIQDIKKNVSKNFTEQSEYVQMDEKLLEKQKQLEELFEKVMTDEMKELFKEMEKLMEKMDKSKIQEMMEKMKLDNKDIEKELDRSLEIFKQLEVEQKLDNVIKKLDELKKQQDELNKESKEKGADAEELKKKQDELNKKFEDLKKDLKEMKDLNKELENPNHMDDTKKEEEQISEDMKESSEELGKGKKSKSSESQEDASEGMEELGKKLQEMQAEMEAGADAEDLDDLRDLLENLVKLSFDQEELMSDFKGTNQKSPEYVKHTQTQKKIKDDAKMIEDSLFALSKRVVEIEPFVNREIAAINENMAKAIQFMADRKTNESTSRQQYVMTSVNNLALLLSEVVEQMQEQMASQKKGESSCKKSGCKKPGCKKPGHGKPSMSSMKGMQQQLNKQIQGMKKGMMPGSKPGNGMSKQLAKMAAEQEMIRNQLEQMNNEMNKDGTGGMGNLEKLAKMMEQTETDLVNRRITQETVNRQKEIMSRLLKAEKAEREREMDNKRKSTEAKNENFGNPTEFFEYNMLKKRETELLRTVPVDLKPYYKNKVNEYFNTFKN
ncbi:MAG: hypothetical protein JKY52_04630 [Flavobacteriales bacterium]|nr:hypothetical protein [Flavobacteriales bacterium]